MKYNTLKALQSAVLETLETRQMMSASPLGSVSIDKGVVTIDGDAQQPSRLIVDYAPNGNLLINANQTFRQYAPSQVKEFVINGGAGADYIYIDPSIDIPANINSGQGNDTIRSGGGNDSITAGNGNDVIYGKNGNNDITVGNGNDTILSGNPTSNDTVHAGSGNDSIVGGGGNNLIVAGDGDDSVIGGGGNDTITVGNGDDLVRGSLGDDSITAGTGQDSLEGDSGNDTLVGGGNGTAVNPGPGSNIIKDAPPPVATTPAAPVAPVKSTSGTSTTNSTAPTTPTTPAAPTTPVSGTTTTTPQKQSASNAPLPTPVLELLAGTRQTGLVVNANGLNSQLNSGTVLNATFQWNFGDPNGTDNTLAGFTAAHIYDTPGTYTITLTVTNGAGGTASTSQQVTIAASSRQQIYVDPINGSDSNNGSESSPIQSLNQAMNMVGNNTELLLKAGQTYTVPATLHFMFTNVVIGSYGSGANPVLSKVVGNGVSTINIFAGSNGITVQNITFDSPYGVGANDVANKTGVSGIYIGGTNVAVRDCKFLNIDDAINENGNPTGVLVEDNTAPLTTGVRGYFDWVQGQEQTIVGNVVANSTREHIVRMVDWTNISIENNNFTNLSRQSVDPNDYSKGCIEMHVGSYAYVVNNKVTDGDIRTGPLGLWGEPVTDTTSWCVIEDNQLTDTFVLEEAGSHNTMIENNVFFENAGGTAISIAGENSQGMESSNVTITNNTVMTTGGSGQFLNVTGPAINITLTNNLWVAPSLTLGNSGNVAVNDANSDLSDFSLISGNVWPASNGGSVSEVGGVYLTGQQWNSLPQVQTDVFDGVTLGNTYQATVGSLTAGADVPLAA